MTTFIIIAIAFGSAVFGYAVACLLAAGRETEEIGNVTVVFRVKPNPAPPCFACGHDPCECGDEEDD